MELQSLALELRQAELQGFSAVILGCGLGLDDAQPDGHDTCMMKHHDSQFSAIKQPPKNYKHHESMPEKTPIFGTVP